MSVKQIAAKQVFSVSEVNAIASETLELLTFWVEGEVSSVQTNPNWYYSYINLKDDQNFLPCFLEPALLNSKQIAVGQKILVFGMLTLFKKNEYKMRIFRIEDVSDGTLQKEFEVLYKKLKKQGLFDEKYKKPIPLYPEKVCLITSLGSAGWNDFKVHTVDKFPIIGLYSVNVRVEGPQAVQKLLNVLAKIDAFGFDVAVITRGGGASEALMEVFNSESLVRAIFKVKTPTIVAVGHEVNTALAELVADRRASTPTDAANLVTQGYTHILEKLVNLRYLVRARANYFFSANFQKLNHYYLNFGKSKIVFKDFPIRLEKLNDHLKQSEKVLIENSGEKLFDLYNKLNREKRQIMATNFQRLDSILGKLLILSPQNTLKRGYSITTDNKGRIIRSVDPVVVGSDIKVKLFDGSLISKVLLKKKNV